MGTAPRILQATSQGREYCSDEATGACAAAKVEQWGFDHGLPWANDLLAVRIFFLSLPEGTRQVHATAFGPIFHLVRRISWLPYLQQCRSTAVFSCAWVPVVAGWRHDVLQEHGHSEKKKK